LTDGDCALAGIEGGE